MTDQTKSTFARRVRAAKPRARKYELRDDAISGLTLRVFPSGARTFTLSRMVRGRRRYATVGNADTMTVSEARAEARKLLAAFLDTVKNEGGPRTPCHPMDAFAGHVPVRQDSARLRAAHPPVRPEGLDCAGAHRGAEPPHRHRPAPRDGVCRGAPPRPRHARPHPRGRKPRRRHPQREGDTDVPRVRRRVSAAVRAALETIWGKTVRNYLKSRILPAFGKLPLDRIAPEDVAAWFYAASKDRPGAANRAFEILRAMMFRAEEWGLRERDSNPCLGIARNPRNNIARFLDTRAGPARPRARRPRGRMARGRRRDPSAGAHRMPPQRSAESSLARHRSGRHQPSRLEDWPARGPARRGRTGAHLRAPRCAARCWCVPISALRRRPVRT